MKRFLSNFSKIPYSKLIFDIISPNTRFTFQNRLLALREFYLQGFFKLIFSGEKVQTRIAISNPLAFIKGNKKCFDLKSQLKGVPQIVNFILPLFALLLLFFSIFLIFLDLKGG